MSERFFGVDLSPAFPPRPPQRPSVEAFTEGMRQVGVAAAAIVEQIKRQILTIAAALDKLFGVRRWPAHAKHGPRNFTADGRWQSDVCAGWLHDSCPAPGPCDCTCHGGSLR